MRLLEIILLALNTLLGLFALANRPLPPQWPVWLTAAITVIVGLHLWLEGYRWQMIPAYLIAGLLVFWLIARIRQPTALDAAAPSPKAWISALKALFALLAATIMIAPPVAFPVPRLPPLTGPYAIGTATYHLIDASRTEIYGDDPNAPRELVVQVWYPAAPPPNAQPAQYFSDLKVVGNAIADKFGWPNFMLDHINLARVRATLDVPVLPAEGGYPVLLFSHGWTSVRSQNTAQIEEIVSHGYIVVGINHTYGALVTVFPDGRAAFVNLESFDEDAPHDEAYEQDVDRLGSWWAADLNFVLDQLEQWQADSDATPFGSQMDLDRIGAFGHSTGGGAIVEMCWQDLRCKAGLGMDTWLIPTKLDAIDAGLTQPFMFMHSEIWSAHITDGRFRRLFDNMHADAYSLTIAGTHHYDFTDVMLLTPLLRPLGLPRGTIDPYRMMRITNQYTLAFFDHYLKDAPRSPLLDGPPTAYPEVAFEQNQLARQTAQP